MCTPKCPCKVGCRGLLCFFGSVFFSFHFFVIVVGDCDGLDGDSKLFLSWYDKPTVVHVVRRSS